MDGGIKGVAFQLYSYMNSPMDNYEPSMLDGGIPTWENDPLGIDRLVKPGRYTRMNAFD